MIEKKSNNELIWLIIILIVLVFGLVGYVVYDKILIVNKENKNDNNTNITTTQKINDKENEDNILRRDNFIYKLNDKNYHISYVYKKYNSDEFYKGQNINIDEAKKYNDYVYNIIYLEILLNDKKIEGVKLPIFYNYEDLNNNELLNRIDLVSSDTINTLKGSDSEYFVFTIEHAHPFTDGGINPVIVNKTGEVIYTIEFQDSTGFWTTDKNSIMYDKGEYFITKDTLYYLMPNCEQTNASGLYFDEFSLKVENDKVIVEKQGTYKGEAAGGAVCGG